MDFPVGLDTLAFSNTQRFHAEAAQFRLACAARGPRPSRVGSLSRRLWAMAGGSVRALREMRSLTSRARVNAEVRRCPHRALSPGGVNPS
jgi:hypothetical protein